MDFYINIYGKLASHVCDPIRKGLMCEKIMPRFILWVFMETVIYFSIDIVMGSLIQFLAL